MIWLGAVLGLRWGEAAGLRVGNVDVLRKTVTIAEQVTRGRGGAGDIGPPKSAAAGRTISIPSELADELSGHMKVLELTGADSEELLFLNAEARPAGLLQLAAPSLGASREGRRLRRSQLPRLPEDQRHRHGRRRRRRQDCTVRLGHSDPRMTLAIYAQATTEGDRRAAGKLGARLMRLQDEGNGASHPAGDG